ncbi:MAG: carbonic anhydrase [Chloroflexota bacterium]|nr:carbonic anhydrase [Chloroflexota bacterium]
MAQEPTRRTFLRALLGMGAGVVAAGALRATPVDAAGLSAPDLSPWATGATQTQISAADALWRLREGNKRFVAGRYLRPNSQPSRRVAVAPAQLPFAVVLSCSDSRVPPEEVFDRGIGDLFVARVAGNSVDDALLGSMEFAVDHYNVPLLVVLGHERCGAVTGAVDMVTKGTTYPGHLPAMINPIRPAVEEVANQSGDMVDNAVRANIRLNVTRLKESEPILAELVHTGKLRIVGARYDLDTGRIDFIA